MWHLHWIDSQSGIMYKTNSTDIFPIFISAWHRLDGPSLRAPSTRSPWTCTLSPLRASEQASCVKHLQQVSRQTREIMKRNIVFENKVFTHRLLSWWAWTLNTFPTSFQKPHCCFGLNHCSRCQDSCRRRQPLFHSGNNHCTREDSWPGCRHTVHSRWRWDTLLLCSLAEGSAGR